MERTPADPSECQPDERRREIAVREHDEQDFRLRRQQRKAEREQDQEGIAPA